MRRSLLILLILTLSGSIAKAEENVAVLSAKGKELAAKDDFHGALTMFKRALAVRQSAVELCNVGGAYYKLQRWPAAHLYLGLCLQRAIEVDDAEFVMVMSSVFAKVEDSMRAGEFAQVRFETSAKDVELHVSALPGDITFGTGQRLWLPTGTHKVNATARGYKPVEQKFTVLRTRSSTVQISLTEVAKTPLQTIPKAGSGTTPIPLRGQHSSESSLASETPVSKRSLSPLAIGSLTLGVGGLASGTVFYLLARKSGQEAEGLLLSDPRRDELQDQFRSRRIASYSLLAVGTIASAIGTYLFLDSGSSGPSLAVQMDLSRGHAEVMGTWRY